jgi:hypothetical protein
MIQQSRFLRLVDSELFDRVMRIIEQIGTQERHFNNLQTGYRKLASTWLLASFAACGYVLKSDSDIPYYKWYFVFGICIAATVGLAILWLLDLSVYQKLLGEFFYQGVLLELEYYKWLPPIRINILRSQKTGDVRSKMQYYYFFSIVTLQLLAIIALWNVDLDLIYQILLSAAIAFSLLIAQISFIAVYIRKKKHFSGDLENNIADQTDKPRKPTLTEMIAHWESLTGGK